MTFLPINYAKRICFCQILDHITHHERETKIFQHNSSVPPNMEAILRDIQPIVTPMKSTIYEIDFGARNIMNNNVM